MLSNYVQATNDTSILRRALPLAEVVSYFMIKFLYFVNVLVQAELKWWQDHRTINVTSPFTNRTHAMAHYAVTNSAPRPESYLTGQFVSTIRETGIRG
jgi:alpha,alpha-trehalase